MEHQPGARVGELVAFLDAVAEPDWLTHLTVRLTTRMSWAWVAQPFRRGPVGGHARSPMGYEPRARVTHCIPPIRATWRCSIDPDAEPSA